MPQFRLPAAADAYGKSRRELERLSGAIIFGDGDIEAKLTVLQVTDDRLGDLVSRAERSTLGVPDWLGFQGLRFFRNISFISFRCFLCCCCECPAMRFVRGHMLAGQCLWNSNAIL